MNRAVELAADVIYLGRQLASITLAATNRLRIALTATERRRSVHAALPPIKRIRVEEEVEWHHGGFDKATKYLQTLLVEATRGKRQSRIKVARASSK